MLEVLAWIVSGVLGLAVFLLALGVLVAAL